MDITVAKLDHEQLVFELNGVDVSFANALRRIMLAEVPTMAIEYVNIEANDTQMHDEVLAHRLGLIPIYADANDYEPCPSREDLVPGKNCIELVLDVTARKQAVKEDGTVHVLSKEFRAVKSEAEQGGKNRLKRAQSSSDDDDEFNFQIHQDIVIAKLKPGHRLKLRCFAVRGLGADHIKWSPVSTAAYRMTPDVQITQPITGADAEEIRKVCPKGVYDIEDDRLVVANNRLCSMCRECVRLPEKKAAIRLGRVPNSFCFSVETTGALRPEEIVKRAVKVLKDKCTNVKDNLV